MLLLFSAEYPTQLTSTRSKEFQEWNLVADVFVMFVLLTSTANWSEAKQWALERVSTYPTSLFFEHRKIQNLRSVPLQCLHYSTCRPSTEELQELQPGVLKKVVKKSYEEKMGISLAFPSPLKHTTDSNQKYLVDKLDTGLTFDVCTWKATY